VVKSGVTSDLSTYVIPAPLGGTPRKLVDGGVAVRWSPDGQRIAYMKPGWSAGDSLWVADADGAHDREIMRASPGIHAHWPAWSADGRFVYFNRSFNSGNLAPIEVFRVPVEGGAPEKVIGTSRYAMYPSLSLDGHGMLYSSNPVGVDRALWWKPVDAAAMRVTTGVGDYAEPRLSRDGQAIVATLFQIRQSLALIAVSGDSSANERILSGGTGDFDPTVSPSGERLALSSTRSGERNIWTADLNGTNGRPVTVGSATDERPAWSPDGRRIAFVSSRGGQRSIWVTDVDGGAPKHIVDAPVLDTIAWSPDGTQLVYAGNAGDVSALFLVPADGGPSRRLHTPASATAPAWSAAANVIAYIQQHAATPSKPLSTEVAFVTPTGEIPRSPLTGVTGLGSYGTIVWSPDGKAIAGAAPSCGYCPWLDQRAGSWIRQGDRVDLHGPMTASTSSWASGWEPAKWCSSIRDANTERPSVGTKASKSPV